MTSAPGRLGSILPYSGNLQLTAPGLQLSVIFFLFVARILFFPFSHLKLSALPAFP